MTSYITISVKPKLKVKSQSITDKLKYIRSQINYYNEHLKEYSEHPDRKEDYKAWLDNRPIGTVIKNNLNMGLAKHIVTTKDNYKLKSPINFDNRIEYLEDFTDGNLGDVGDFSRHDQFSISFTFNLINDSLKNTKSNSSYIEADPIVSILFKIPLVISVIVFIIIIYYTHYSYLIY